MAVDDNQQRVRTRDLSWRELVQKAWGKDWNKPDPAYEFPGHTFDDPKQGGPYDPNRG